MSLQRALVLSAMLAVTGVACDDGGGEAAPSSTTTTTTTQATPVVDRDACVGVEVVESGGTDDVRGEPGRGLLLISGVDVGADDSGCVEQVAFSFEEESAESSPGYVVGYRDPPFADVSGRRVAVDGEAFLSVTFLNGTGVDLSGDEARETLRPPRFEGGEGAIRDLQLVSDFEGVSEWIIGLDRTRPFRVHYDAAAFAFVIDIAAG